MDLFVVQTQQDLLHLKTDNKPFALQAENSFEIPPSVGGIAIVICNCNVLNNNYPCKFV